MRVYLHPNIQKQDALPVAEQAAEVLCGAGVDVLVDAAYQECFRQGNKVHYVSKEQAWQDCDVVVTVGGDGTILHAAKKTTSYQKPLLGINTGRLGFLTAVERYELEKLLRLPRGEYRVEHRGVLELSCGAWENSYALNDIVFFKESPEKSISLDIYCDEVLVSSFRGDGVIIATPTGSTAYSMSAGGPIVDARLAGIIITQICAHVVQTPPLVFAADRVLRVDTAGTMEEGVFMSCDGRRCHELPPGTPATIRQSNITVPLIQFNDADQLKSIDKKLKGR